MKTSLILCNISPLFTPPLVYTEIIYIFGGLR